MRIHSVQVQGFRSLSKVSIGKFGPINIFYGENNAGKSNILAALEVLFKVERPKERESTVGGFLHSEFSNFVDNFTLDSSGKPTSQILITANLLLSNSDLSKLPIFCDLIKTQKIWKKRPLQNIQLEALIEYSEKGKATKTLKSAKVNKVLLYNSAAPSNITFFPSLSSLPVQDRQSAAEELLSQLVNSFFVIRAERFLHEESFSMEPVTQISAEQFKNWILNLSRSRGEDYQKLQGIVDWFNSVEFRYGVIRPIVEINKVGLVVKDAAGRELIVDRLGNGVQQILILLANLVDSKARMVGIEEVETNLSPALQNRVLTMFKEMVAKPERSIDQLFLTSHSEHLSTHNDVVLYAVETGSVGTTVTWGPSAVGKLRAHFDYGLIRLPKGKFLR
jgi:predicted ATP-dependent endonuclease of OLD family